MPRVNTATKSKVGAKRECRRCSAVIKPGEKYFFYKFRYGGTYYHCHLHPPKSSDLTQSKMSGVYSAIEAIEDVIGQVRAGTADLSDLVNTLESSADEVESVRDEYSDSLSNMPESLQGGSTGEEIQEKIDALEEFAQTLRDVEIEEESEADETDDEKQERIDAACDAAESACGEFSL